MAFTDNFNRANENLEASVSWTHDGLIAGALGIVSNQLRCTTSDGAGSAYKAPDQGSADHYVQFTIQNVSASSGPFIACRLADRNNFVGIRNGGGFLIVYRRVAGALTHLWEDAVVTLGNTVRFECQGSNWTVKVNGVTVQTGAIGDASLTSTRTGLVARAVVTDPWIDDFETGPLAAPAVTGTMAAAESGSDTLAASGRVLVQGALATAETGTDTASGAGRVLVAGLLAATEAGSDSAAISGKVLVSGTLAAVETGSDTFSGSSVEVVTPSWRRASVSAENRVAAVASESRSARCLAERRTAAVTAENRTAMVV